MVFPYLLIVGPQGFGFTIYDSTIGQCVKQVMDRERCKELQEGDMLVSIGNKLLNTCTHNQVVQALKDCKHGTTSLITVQRTGEYTYNKEGCGELSKIL